MKKYWKLIHVQLYVLCWYQADIRKLMKKAIR